jgi:acylphosphatase
MSGQGRKHPSDERARSGAPRGSEPRARATRVVAVVSGHVQGVGYRYFVRVVAAERGLTGSARNLPDGRVEVVLEGAEQTDVREAVAALSGPDAPGTVTSVDTRDEAAQGSTGFTVA